MVKEASIGMTCPHTIMGGQGSVNRDDMSACNHGWSMNFSSISGNRLSAIYINNTETLIRFNVRRTDKLYSVIVSNGLSSYAKP